MFGDNGGYIDGTAVGVILFEFIQGRRLGIHRISFVDSSHKCFEIAALITASSDTCYIEPHKCRKS